MGKINQGILGGFSGKVGNVIGGNWKGIDYMRVKPTSVANPQTDGQVDQRTKFSTVLKFVQSMKDYVKIGYQNYAIKMTEFNSAMSYNLKNAITGTSPDFEIDYASALISRGTLASALNGTVSSSAAGSINFTWDDNSADGNANKKDKAMILAYNESQQESVFITNGSNRSTGNSSLTVPSNYSGETVYCFIAFINENGDTVSNSKYLGSVVVA